MCPDVRQGAARSAAFSLQKRAATLRFRSQRAARGQQGRSGQPAVEAAMPRDETKDEDDSSDGDGPEFVDMIAACKFSFPPPHKGNQSGGGNYWIRTRVHDCSEIGTPGLFGRMENANWVILRCRSQKCTQFSLGPRF